jgi:amidohydrolase
MMLNPISTRHLLHSKPELSGQEIQTSAFVVSQLKLIGVSKIHTGFSQCSVLAEIDGQQSGQTLLFRCELDALPIQEVNDFAHRSTHKGISHKCGHDGHIATMLAFSEKLVEKPIQNGKILLLFQSAEENAEGAKSIIASGFLEQFAIDFVFSYHNIPSLPLGAIACKKSIFTPSVESFCIKLTGKKCHASQPSQGINPAIAIADFIRFINTLHQSDKTESDYFVATPIYISMGEKTYGISAGCAEIGYTIRTFDSRVLEQFKQKIVNTITSICKSEGLSFHISWFEAFKSNNNAPEAFEYIKSAAAQNDLPFIEMNQPFDFGEDFGLFTDTYKGAMFGIGSGIDCPALHTNDYDFPDELIDIGSNLFYVLSTQ